MTREGCAGVDVYKRQVTHDDASTIEIGRRVILGLSFDHRVCEPVGAVEYLERVGQLLAGLDVEGER